MGRSAIYYYNCLRYQLDDADDDNVDCNLYRPSALRALYKSYKDTEIYALLDTIQVKYVIFCDEMEKEKTFAKRRDTTNTSEGA